MVSRKWVPVSSEQPIGRGTVRSDRRAFPHRMENKTSVERLPKARVASVSSSTLQECSSLAAVWVTGQLPVELPKLLVNHCLPKRGEVEVEHARSSKHRKASTVPSIVAPARSHVAQSLWAEWAS